MPTARALLPILAAAAAVPVWAGEKAPAAPQEKAFAAPQEKARAAPQEKADAVPLEKAPSAASETPRPAGRRRVLNLEFVSCADYLRLSDLEKAPVAWYLAGFYRATGVSPLRFDLEWATSTPPVVTMECDKHPDASLLYVVGNLFKPRKRAKGKAVP